VNITLLKNISENNKIGKTLTIISSISGSLRDQSSIIDPVLIVSGSTSIIMESNYLRIEDFERYYFIKNIVAIRTGIWEITAHVDVLETYSTQIKAQTAVIKRQEKKWNLYLDDGIFKTYQNPTIVTKVFPSGFTSQNFVLAVAGG
jgi:hypothetical protein